MVASSIVVNADILKKVYVPAEIFSVGETGEVLDAYIASQDAAEPSSERV